MKKLTFGEQLLALRKERGLTQAELSKLAAIRQQKISDYENQRAWPDREECLRLSAALSVDPRRLLTRARPSMSHSSAVFGLYDRRVHFSPPCKKSGVERLASAMAQHRELVEPLWDKLDHSRRSWLEVVSTDSLDEWLLLLHRLSAGLEPSICAPLKLGLRQHPIVDYDTGEAVGDLAVPVLVGRVSGVSQAIVPQLCFQVGTVRYPMDFALVVVSRRRRWVIDGEVDGGGHKPANERYRARQLGLPALRFRDEVFRSDFNAHFEFRLSRLLNL